ncbi:hypothetical protein CDO52_07405 [Nocardiopsis gilva YIM 90087]|uniref:Uncharacterized protein n=1 Tax=Nocardiopsis gilva YIM 90087 TaxID=1235441 RepID=A0A223S3C3_9ACTN|nr:hypothetical protein [Nocardiopsis gilva]ASU82633.1 hypothetical protein CDO52_07405 [Nocardiopsis gilva YIM 90087]
MQLDQPLFRALRAGLFAAVCVAISAGLHCSAGGAPVGWGALGLAVLLVGAGGYTLAGAQRGLAPIMAAAFVTQFGLHHLFSAAAVTPSGMTTATADAAAGGMHHTMGGSSGMAMLLVHVFTALLTAWWLERGESDLAELLRLLGAHLPLLLAAPRPLTVPPHPRLRRRPDKPRPVEQLLARTVRRRGPPGCAFVFHSGPAVMTR